MPYSCIKRQSMKILYKASYSRYIIEKDVKVNIMRFRTLRYLLNFKASAAETGIFHGLTTIFLESTVHKLSTNALLLYH